MSGQTWTCPSCAQKFAMDVRVCPVCKVTQIRRWGADKSPEERAQFLAETVEVALPHVIPEARFNVPLDTGPTWTSGRLLVAPSGLFFLSEKDSFPSPEALSRNPPALPGRLGSLSFFIPRPLLRRVVHDRLTGFFVEMEGNKIPARLDAAGWRALDAACDKLGIPHK